MAKKAKKAKKVMKKVEVKTTEVTKATLDKVRALIQPFLKKYDLVFSATKTGALQWRRNGDVILTCVRHTFKVVLPKSEILDICPGARSCEGNHHMSWVPYDEVSRNLIIRKLKDKRTNAQVEKAVYTKTGMSQARTRYFAAKGEAEKATKKAKKAKVKGAIAKKATKKKVTRKPAKVPGKLARRAAEAAA